MGEAPSQDDTNQLVEYDVEIGQLSKSKQHAGHTKFINGLSKIKADDLEIEKLLERIEVVKDETRKLLSGKVIIKAKLLSDLRARVVARAANKNACRTAPIA